MAIALWPGLIEGKPAGQGPLMRVAEHLPGVARSPRRPGPGPHAAGITAQHDRRRSTAVEQDRGVAAQSAEKVLDVVRRIAPALEDVHLVLLLRVGEGRTRGAWTAVVELSGVAGGQQPDPRHRNEPLVLVQQVLHHRSCDVIVLSALGPHHIWAPARRRDPRRQRAPALAAAGEPLLAGIGHGAGDRLVGTTLAMGVVDEGPQG